MGPIGPTEHANAEEFRATNQSEGADWGFGEHAQGIHYYVQVSVFSS